jgi:chromosome segregation ATPase
MLKENEAKIIELTEQNQKFVTQLMHKDELLKEFEDKFKQLQQDVRQHEIEVNQNVGNADGFQTSGQRDQKNSQQPLSSEGMQNLDVISERLKKVYANLNHRLAYIQKDEFYLKINVIKKAIAMAKAKQEIQKSTELTNTLSSKSEEINDLKQKLEKVREFLGISLTIFRLKICQNLQLQKPTLLQ